MRGDYQKSYCEWRVIAEDKPKLEIEKSNHVGLLCFGFAVGALLAVVVY